MKPILAEHKTSVNATRRAGRNPRKQNREGSRHLWLKALFLWHSPNGMIQNPHIMSVAIFSRTPPPSGRFLFSADRRSPLSSQALVRKEKREAREGRRKRETWRVHCPPPPPSPGLRDPEACMDGRKGDRWTVKPSSVQPGYTLVGTLWVRLGGRGQ